MANILNKISSIEPEDDVASKALNTRPKTPAEPDIEPRSKSIPAKPAFLVEQSAVDTRVEPLSAPSFRWMKIVFTLAIIAWLVTSIILSLSFFDFGKGLSTLSPMQVAGLGLFIIAPILLFALTAYAFKQLAKISSHAHKLEQSVQDLLTPDETTVSRSSIMAQSITKEIDRVNHEIDVAINRMDRLKVTLETQIKDIGETSYGAESKTELIAKRLSDERDALKSMASTFDDRMSDLSHMLDQQSDTLEKSSQIAELKVQEARISVEDAVTSINSASDSVKKNAIDAATSLGSNRDELSRLGNELRHQALDMDNVHQKHADDLSRMVTTLKNEQESISLMLEERLNKMRDMSLSAQLSSKTLSEASASGQEIINALASAARLTETAVKKRFTEMEDMVRYSNDRAESIGEKATRRVQDSLAHTRKEIARIENDMLELEGKLSTQIEYAITPEPLHKSPEDTSSKLFKETPKKRLSISPITHDEDSHDKRKNRKSPKSGRLLSGLRPAHDPDPDTPEYADISASEKDTPVIEMSAPNMAVIKTEPDVELTPDEDDFSLDIEIPKAEDIQAPDPDADIKNFDPDIPRRTLVENDNRRRKNSETQPQTSWWKTLLSSGRSTETLAIDSLTARANSPEPEISKNSQQAVAPENTTTRVKPVASPNYTKDKSDKKQADIVKALSDLGLSPGAIVDDGCIIEAVNTRKSKGPLAMSMITAQRLEKPVNHLYKAMRSDDDLKHKITEFARSFYAGLEYIEDDREALRQRLESDIGRAFLLSDAALNL